MTNMYYVTVFKNMLNLIRIDLKTQLQNERDGKIWAEYNRPLSNYGPNHHKLIVFSLVVVKKGIQCNMCRMKYVTAL